MANTKTAKENIKINRRNTIRNRHYKSSLRTAMTKSLQALDTGEKTEQAVRSTLRLLDKLVTKGILKKQTVARKKSKLTKLFNAKTR